MKYLYALKVYCGENNRPYWVSSDIPNQNIENIHTFDTYEKAFEYANTINANIEIIKLRKQKGDWYICKKSQMIVKPSYLKF